MHALLFVDNRGSGANNAQRMKTKSSPNEWAQISWVRDKIPRMELFGLAF
jgi:hypothetical protein